MSAKIKERSQQFDPGTLVTLFELDLTALGGTVERFTSSIDAGGAIVFDGNTYTAIPIEADGFEWTGRGPLPKPTLRIANVNKVAHALVIGFDDLVGASLKRIRTFQEFLDNGSDPDPTAIFPVDLYVVERKRAHNKVFIEWELSAAMDQQGRMLPGRQVLREACTHRYRVFDPNTNDFDFTNATCPYTADPSFDETGAAVSKVNDRCGKRLSDCRIRFGETAELPTLQFPGVARVR